MHFAWDCRVCTMSREGIQTLGFTEDGPLARRRKERGRHSLGGIVCSRRAPRALARGEFGVALTLFLG